AQWGPKRATREAPSRVEPDPLEPQKPAATRDDATGQFTKADQQKPDRRRSAKQQAGADDSPRIAELTKKWREAERERDEWKAKAQPAQDAPRPIPPPRDAPTFTKPEPKLEDFASDPDPYGAWLRASSRWDREKDKFEEQQAQHQSETAAQQKAMQEHA